MGRQRPAGYGVAGKFRKKRLDQTFCFPYDGRMTKYQIVDKNGSPYSVAFEKQNDSEAKRVLVAYKGAMPRANGLRLVNVETGKEVAKRIR